MKIENEDLENCLEKLQDASNDEELMVQLTLLPRILDPTNQQEMEKAYSSIPWSFVHRLLITPIGKDSLMQTIAIHIWSGFATKPFSSHSKFLKRLQPVSKLLLANIAQEEKYLILSTIMKVVLETENWQCLSRDILVNLSCVSGTILESSMLDFLPHLIEKADSSTRQLLPEIFLGFVSRILLHDDAIKFRGLEVAIQLLSLDNDCTVGNQVLSQFKSACKSILRSKLSKTYTEQVLILCSLLSIKAPFLKVKGEDLSENLKGKLNISATKSMTDNQIVTMLTHLACAEVRVILDSTTPDLEPESNEFLPLYYSLLENIIKSLINDDLVDLQHKELESIRKALYETFLAVAAFLSERWVALANQDIFQDTREIKVLDNLTTIFSLGAYSNWVAEESAIPIEQIECLTPLVIEMCKTDFKSMNVDTFELCHELLGLITSEPSCLDLFMEQGGEVLLVNRFITTQSSDTKLSLASVVMNIIVSSDGMKLEQKVSLYSKLFPSLMRLIKDGSYV